MAFAKELASPAVWPDYLPHFPKKHEVVMVPFRTPALLSAGLMSLALTAVLPGADGLGDDHPRTRLIGEVLVGTANFEPGVAAEFTFVADHSWRLRPEVFVNDDGRVGAAVSLGWELPFFERNQGQELYIGPRVVYHNSDDYGFGADFQAVYSYAFIPGNDRHYLQVIGAVGAVNDRSGDDNRTRFSGTVGIAYGFQF